MAHFVVDEDAIGLLSAQSLPIAFGGSVNPYKDLVEWLDKTRGRWWHHNEVPRSELSKHGFNNRPGLELFRRRVSDQYGTDVPDGMIYMSPFFTYSRVPLSVLPSAFTMMAAASLYFELIDYEAFVTIADADYDDVVPAYLPNSATTWRNWKRLGNEHRSIDGQNHIPLTSMTGNWLAGSILTQLIAGGFTVQPFEDYPEPPSEA